MAKDKALVRDYTGSDVGYVAELYIYGRNGDRISVTPLTAKEALNMGLDLIARAARVAFR
jgi:hypothetical protein